MEHEAHDPREELRGSRTTDDLASGPLGKGQRPAGASPQTDQPAESPQVHEEDQRVRFTPDRGDEIPLHDVTWQLVPDLATDHAPHGDPDEQRADDLAGGERQNDRHRGRHHRPDAEMVALLWETSNGGQGHDEDEAAHEQGDAPLGHRGPPELTSSVPAGGRRSPTLTRAEACWEGRHPGNPRLARRVRCMAPVRCPVEIWCMRSRSEEHSGGGPS